MSSPLRSKKRGNMIIWILMGMLILGLGGFGATNFGGSVRSIGSVGDRDIDLRDYARALQSEIRALSGQIGQQLSFEQAQSLGIDRDVQARVIGSVALENEADKIGISVGDATVRDRVLAVEAFKGLSGEFDRDTYALALRQEGLSEAEFETKLRDEAARTLLQSAVLGAATAPGSYVESIASWLTETRSFSLAELTASDLAEPVPVPTDDEMKAYYDAHPEDFTKPEARRISYVWLSPEMLADKVELDEEALKAAYQDRIDEYVTPELRLVERLVYPDEETAAAAKARLDSGEATFEDLAAERGLTLADIDLGEVAEADLGAAGAAIFALDTPGVVGPFASDLGPALFAMNGILEAKEVPFEDARDDLAAEASVDRARRLVADQSDGIEDLLASGATLEEVATETGMELGQIEFSDGTDEGIAAYPAFREEAAAVTAEAFPTLVALDDGGIFALRLDGIDPPALRPLDEVRDAVIAGWTRQETHTRLLARAEELKAAVEGGAALEATGAIVTRFADFARDGHIADTPADVVTTLFKQNEGGVAVIDTSSRVFVGALTGIHAADAEGDDMTRARQALTAQAGQAVAQDMFELFTHAIEAEAGIRLDPAAINAVHAQLN
ncbi:SurA N-terminal domain-containing protein [Defluviimonas sp. WL0050]|uniref:SurA N-terminal domain-containing protein n=1 Tax=Albidovulum litorale TaxID=2984134 RepID=A0ABT2ZPV5_9RHOB|nr:peptidyl-prolyl cis-trans isomerase [Defluviimonas sp. WL0050]MCV2873178.1 SurA N-terminal domain-containing protein [Defluviimonas sp. WL0050]